VDPQREPRLTPDLHLDRGHSTGGGPTVFGSCSEHSSAGDRSSNCGCNRAGLSSAMTSRNDARRSDCFRLMFRTQFSGRQELKLRLQQGRSELRDDFLE